MSCRFCYRLTAGVYWLFLGTWFGALVMLVITAAVTFKTVRYFEPSLGLPPYDQPIFADRQATILAGGIVGNLLMALAVLQAVCATVVGLCAVVQCAFMADRAGRITSKGNLLRILLILGPVLILFVDTMFLTPRLHEQRRLMDDPQRSAEVRGEAKAEFHRFHELSVQMTSASMAMLAGAVLASAFVLHGGGESPAAPVAGAAEASE